MFLLHFHTAQNVMFTHGLADGLPFQQYKKTTYEKWNEWDRCYIFSSSPKRSNVSVQFLFLSRVAPPCNTFNTWKICQDGSGSTGNLHQHIFPFLLITLRYQSIFGASGSISRHPLQGIMLLSQCFCFFVCKKGVRVIMIRICVMYYCTIWLVGKCSGSYWLSQSRIRKISQRRSAVSMLLQLWLSYGSLNSIRLTNCVSVCVYLNLLCAAREQQNS